jgi:hypothetical protein
MERRASFRKQIKLACTLQSYAGVTWYGHTRDLSAEGAQVDCPGIALPGRQTLKIGDPVVLSFSFRIGGRQETVTVGCRAVRITGSTIGLQMFSGSLPKARRARLAILLADLV